MRPILHPTRPNGVGESWTDGEKILGITVFGRWCPRSVDWPLRMQNETWGEFFKKCSYRCVSGCTIPWNISESLLKRLKQQQLKLKRWNHLSSCSFLTMTKEPKRVHSTRWCHVYWARQHWSRKRPQNWWLKGGFLSTQTGIYLERTRRLSADQKAKQQGRKEAADFTLF